MRKVFAFIALLCTVCLNVQCQKAEVHLADGSTVEIPVDEIDSITFSMTNPFNFETKTVKLNSGYEMPIIGIGTYLSGPPPLASAVRHHRHSRFQQSRPYRRGLRHLRLRTDSRRDAAHQRPGVQPPLCIVLNRTNGIPHQKHVCFRWDVKHMRTFCVRIAPKASFVWA